MRKEGIQSIVFLIFLFGICSGCLSFRESDRNLYHGMKKEGVEFEIHYSSKDTLRGLWYKNGKKL